MKEWTYTIQDAVGMHARPAGLLVKEAQKFSSQVTVYKDGKAADAKKLLKLMGLGVSCGDTVTITCEGADEEACAAALQTFFQEYL